MQKGLLQATLFLRPHLLVNIGLQSIFQQKR
ncbi:BgTH12-06224 [Blumeria graminis f. sp. triticale]|uniref:BgTH12-06224 n=1 Tax=Blumeria graminis f. sp. triticale TaxID=1689686 RepID=A0A9W4GCF5_BLUGR|nr:BgTH12-06224 [Blumeria graminis f. sp. triticale]